MATTIDDPKKTALPDSDQSARQKHAQEQEEENWNEVTDVVKTTQTSHKSGKHSTAEKLAASRPEFSEGRGAKPVDGASGSGEEEREDLPGRRGA
jgi:hypothetical protein